MAFSFGPNGFREENSDIKFILEIIDGMYDWVRVLDKNSNIIFLNKAMADALNCYAPGKKCYELLGREAPCENCISRKAVFNGYPHEKEEIINGRIFSVMSSPVRNQNGEIIAVVEVLRDVTQMKQMQQKIIEHNKNLQNNLEMAKKLQYSLLPDEFFDERINFSYFYESCEMLGGDFIDIFAIDEDHIGVYIADVSGHGVPASMLTVFLFSSINREILSPASALEGLYKKFNCSSLGNNMYITVFYAIINLKDRKMTYSNAGHNVCPIVFGNNRFELLRVPGVPISNWVNTPSYTDRSIILNPKDRLFLYTDGLIELKNSEGEQFGEERLLNILLNDTSRPDAVLSKIYKAASKFASPEKPLQLADDITMALLEIK
ncbi:MAG TPA: SpoIIE family protein phosphatase [Clostridiaceae bacterium]|nr:SpoIIE family protein phosphatase [Clostridiaceae bacterium]